MQPPLGALIRLAALFANSLGNLGRRQMSPLIPGSWPYACLLKISNLQSRQGGDGQDRMCV